MCSTVSITFSSDLSGTISGGSADRLGLLPARLLLDKIGDRGTDEPVIVAEESDMTDNLSFELGPDGSRLTPPAALVILALDRLRVAVCPPVLLEVDIPRR